MQLIDKQRDVMLKLIASRENRPYEEVVKEYKGISSGRNPINARLHHEVETAIALLNADMGEISDGYHTFNELYRYRMLYNAAWFNTVLHGKLNPREVVKSHKHNDGEECFGGGWFIVMAQLPTGQISNHYENKYWYLFDVPEVEKAPKWDGHTPEQAAERIEKYLKGDY